jgi:hypothetical protein
LPKQKEIWENENYFLIHAETGNEAGPPQSTLFEGSALGGRSYCMRKLPSAVFKSFSLHREELGTVRVTKKVALRKVFF